MKDYEDIGLTNRLQSSNGLAAKNRYVTSYDFDSNFEGVGAANFVGGVVKTRLIINDGSNDRVVIGKLT